MDKLRIRPRKEVDMEAYREKLERVDLAAIGHYTEFGFMDPKIHKVIKGANRFFGPAVTVRVPAQESKAVHLAVSMAREGDVLVIDRCGDESHAAVGEMVALCAKTRKLAGIVIDGPLTDMKAITDMGLPVFATGVSALTTKFIADNGEINYDISCGGVPVHAGDIIMADENGVLVLRDFEIGDLLNAAIQDQMEEAEDKREVIAGKTLQELYVPEYPAE